MRTAKKGTDFENYCVFTSQALALGRYSSPSSASPSQVPLSCLLLLLPAVSHASTGELPASLPGSPSIDGEKLHPCHSSQVVGRQLASCYTSSTFHAMHMSERALCPSAAWGCNLGPGGLLSVLWSFYEALETIVL
eukprot:1161462-Pelagomonas_calceolata.AAC.5